MPPSPDKEEPMNGRSLGQGTLLCVDEFFIFYNFLGIDRLQQNCSVGRSAGFLRALQKGSAAFVQLSSAVVGQILRRCNQPLRRESSFVRLALTSSQTKTK